MDCIGALFRIEFDDHLFLNGEIHVLALGQRDRLAAQGRPVELQPGRDRPAAGEVQGSLDGGEVSTFLAHRDRLSRRDLKLRNVYFAPANLDVAVADELPRFGTGGGEPQAVNRVVQTALE